MLPWKLWPARRGRAGRCRVTCRIVEGHARAIRLSTWLSMIAGPGERTEASRQLEEASRLAEEAAASAAAAAAAASLGQSMPGAQGMLEAGRGPLNTVSERGIPCKVSRFPAVPFLLLATFTCTVVSLHDNDVSVMMTRTTGAYQEPARRTDSHLMICMSYNMRLADSLHFSHSDHGPHMQGPAKALEGSLEGALQQKLPAMPQACLDALAAERQAWQLHSKISELALLTHRLFSAPEVRGIVQSP